jgi:hypothetical protein
VVEVEVEVVAEYPPNSPTQQRNHHRK